MPQIHPTAIVDPRARLAEDVRVGPWCIIEGDVTLGAGCRLIAGVHLFGPMQVGAGNVFYSHAVLGCCPQHTRADPEAAGSGLVIGPGNVFREGFTAHRALGDRPTTIGGGGYFMSNSHVGHDCVVGDGVTLASGALLGGHVELGDRAFVGGNGAVHQFVRVGRLCMLAGVVGTMRDVPPFCLVGNFRGLDSLNRVGLRRAGLREHIPALQKAFDFTFHCGHSNPRAVERIRRELAGDPLAMEFADFVAGTKRGLTQPDAGIRAGVLAEPIQTRSSGDPAS